MKVSEAKERVNKIRQRKRKFSVGVELFFNVTSGIFWFVIAYFNFVAGSSLSSVLSLPLGVFFFSMALSTWGQSKTVKAYEAYISELKKDAARSKGADNQESE